MIGSLWANCDYLTPRGRLQLSGLAARRGGHGATAGPASQRAEFVPEIVGLADIAAAFLPQSEGAYTLMGIFVNLYL